MEFFIFIGVSICLVLIGDYVLRRKLKVLKHEKMAPQPKRIENIVVTVIIIAYFIIAVPFAFKSEDANLLVIALPFFIIISLIRAFMEWRFNREARHWAMEIYSIISIVVVALLLLMNFN